MKSSFLTSLILSYLFLAYFFIQGAELVSVTFILPRGYPYKEIGFQSERERSVVLKFGDELRVLKESAKEGALWYHCLEGQHRFYVPETFVVKTARGGIFCDQEGNIFTGREGVDQNHPLPLFYRPSDLVVIPTRYRANGYEKRRIMLRREAAGSFMRLMDDAQKQGVTIRILSGFRDSRYQSYLYRKALQRHGMFQNSVAKPGHSEHQLGTASDLTTDEINSALSVRFEHTSAFRWLMEHGHEYGIALSYPKHKNRQTGYTYEPWHYRFWSSNRWGHYRRKHSIFFGR